MREGIHGTDPEPSLIMVLHKVRLVDRGEESPLSPLPALPMARVEESIHWLYSTRLYRRICIYGLYLGLGSWRVYTGYTRLDSINVH
jgi:hypothetical protein